MNNDPHYQLLVSFVHALTKYQINGLLDEVGGILRLQDKGHVLVNYKTGEDGGSTKTLENLAKWHKRPDGGSFMCPEMRFTAGGLGSIWQDLLIETKGKGTKAFVEFESPVRVGLDPHKGLFRPHCDVQQCAMASLQHPACVGLINRPYNEQVQAFAESLRENPLLLPKEEICLHVDIDMSNEVMFNGWRHKVETQVRARLVVYEDEEEESDEEE